MGGKQSKQSKHIGGLFKCKKTYHGSPQESRSGHSRWCANEGGRCTADFGSAKVYYGAGFTWATKTLSHGQAIQCTNDAFGCDPSPGISKWCFKFQTARCNGQDVCPRGWHNVYYKDSGGLSAEEKRQIYCRECPTFPNGHACSPCSVSAHSVVPELDEWNPENNESIVPSLYTLDLYLVPILALIVLILTCCQCWTFIKLCKVKAQKRYRVVKNLEYDNEVDREEAIPMNE